MWNLAVFRRVLRTLIPPCIYAVIFLSATYVNDMMQIWKIIVKRR